MKIAKSLRGHRHSLETRRKMSIAKKNMSTGTRKKISDSLTGRKIKLETKKKISNSLIGHRHSPETLLRLSKSHKGQIPWNKGKKLKN